LRQSGSPVKLREQSFLVLVHLLEHAGEIVTREELRRVLWPSDTFVDYDHSLNVAVMSLREALGDSTDIPVYIETIPKHGYRFIAPVTITSEIRDGRVNLHVEAELAPARGTDSANRPARTLEKSPTRRWPFGRATTAIGLALLVAAAVAVFLWTRPFSAPSPALNNASSDFRIVPITAGAGNAVNPVLSPNGAWIAFVWDGPERKSDDVYVQMVGSDSAPVRLTSNKSGFIFALAWSPDGREIAFTHCDEKNDGVFAVPALGGVERKLSDIGCIGFAGPASLDWLSNGNGILVTHRCSAERRPGLILFNLSTGEKRCLVQPGPPNNFSAIFQFSLSPDGNTIAFTASNNTYRHCEIYTVPFSGGAPHQLTWGGQSFSKIMWTPNSKSIVFASTRTILPSFLRVSASGGPIEREMTYPAIGSMSSDGRRFVYSEVTLAEGPDIWRAELAAAGGPVLDNRKLIQSQFVEADARPSADGKRLAWISGRTGDEEVWVGDKTGRSPVQVTRLNRNSGAPRWSPDGKWIVFNSFVGENRHIFVVDPEGRDLHEITDGPFDDYTPSWSQDGKSIYFVSNRSGVWTIWKHSLADGTEVQLSKSDAVNPVESYDGRTIYFSCGNPWVGIWSIPSSGGTAKQVVADKPQAGFWAYWAVTKAGLYFVNTDAEPKPRIEYYDSATRRITPVLDFAKPATHNNSIDMSATADGRTIYYTQADQQSVIKMMEFAY